MLPSIEQGSLWVRAFLFHILTMFLHSEYMNLLLRSQPKFFVGAFGLVTPTVRVKVRFRDVIIICQQVHRTCKCGLYFVCHLVLEASLMHAVYQFTETRILKVSLCHYCKVRIEASGRLALLSVMAVRCVGICWPSSSLALNAHCTLPFYLLFRYHILYIIIINV